MKKFGAAILTTLVAGGLFVSTAISAPIGVGDWINISRTDNFFGNGGEFKITKQGETDFTWISFCLEKEEFINITPGYNSYRIETIADYATAGGVNSDKGELGRDSLSKATKWLMDAYVNNFEKLAAFGYTSKSDNFAGIVQNTIWYFEDEIGSLYGDSLTFAQNVAGLFAGGANVNDANYFTNAKLSDATYMTWVQAVNLVDGEGKAVQSQVVANPVPEPATMLLFGAGLAGLAGLARRRKQAS